MKAALALEPGRRRSPEGQGKFDKRLKLLLIATAHRLSPDFHQAMRHDESFASVREAGLSWVDRRSREARYLVLTHAAEKVLGPRAASWLRATRSPNGAMSITDFALRDDEGLKDALDALALLTEQVQRAT